jgi:hypothetical protein
MKKQSASRSAFFNPRVLIGFALCSIGVLLALPGLSKSVSGMIAARGTANPVPLINQPLVPDAVAPGGAGFTLTVNGTGFVSESVVNWNGSARTTSFVNSSKLTASIPARDIATASSASVTVVNPSPGGGTSNVVFLSITVATSGIVLNRADLVTGTHPESLATGDFDGDGNADLAVPNNVSNTVSVLLGNGDGSFRRHVNYATGVDPQSVSVGDFNKDSKIDLAVPNALSNTISVLLGNGDGTFQAHVDYQDVEPTFAVVADFDADGNVDLVTISPAGGTVSVLLGNGDGTFQAHVDYPVGVLSTGIKAGDFNTDGKLDLVVSNLTSTVSILLGNGDGTFQAHVDYAAGFGPNDVSVADLDADGILDLVIPNLSLNAVSILLGNGDGSFKWASDWYLEGSAIKCDVGDLNGDGKLDLVLPDSANALSILLGNGDGTFQAPVYFATPGALFDAVTADFDGDGRLDVAVTNSIFLQPALVNQGCAESPPGLVSWWSGDQTADDVQGTNNGTLLNGASFAKGMVGPGFVFDGIDDAVVIPNSASLSPSQLTLDAWIYATGKAGTGRHIISKDNEAVAREWILAIASQDEFEADIWLPNNVQVMARGATIVQLNTWYHVAMTHDGVNLRLYVNGVLEATTDAVGTIVPTDNPVGIGQNPFGLGGSLAFEGIIDEAQIFDRALTDAEILGIYQAGTDGQCKPDIFVASIDPSYTVSGHGFRISTSILIQDVNGVGINGATVQLGVILPSGSALTFQLKTDAAGQANISFTVDDSGLYKFKVRNVNHPIREYDPSLNIETSDTLLIP